MPTLLIQCELQVCISLQFTSLQYPLSYKLNR